MKRFVLRVLRFVGPLLGSVVVGALVDGGIGFGLIGLSVGYSLWVGLGLGATTGLAVGVLALLDPYGRWEGTGQWLGLLLGFMTFLGVLVMLCRSGPGGMPTLTSDWLYLCGFGVFCASGGYLAGRLCEPAARGVQERLGG